jgi:putative tryptophan/tyrosine transport system substrate-binding protein
MRRRNFISLVGGAAVAWPIAARAQRPALPVVGFVSSANAQSTPHMTAAFQAGLKENGFTEGENVAIEYRWADGHLERLPSLVADLVRRRVAVIFSTGGDVPTLVAKGATTTIPIVFATGADPLRSGLVASLNRPGGNATGATVVAGLLGAKRIALLRELAPNTYALGLLVNPNNPNAEPETADIEAAAQSMRAQVQVLPASNGEEIEAAFAALARSKLDGLVVNPDPIFFPRRDQIVAMAARQAVPTIYYSREYAEAGGLMSYGASFTWLYRQCGIYVARILQGAKPADLPVVQPTRFELVINANTAKTLGLTVPPTLLATVDEVIE